MRRGSIPLRLFLVLAFVAAILVPAWVRPARAITIPITLARSVRAGGAGRVATAFAPTHLAFSWRGPDRSGIEYRTFSHGRGSRWRRAPESHDMEYGDHHFSAVISVARPSGIQWRKAGAERRLMSGIVVDYLNTIDGPRRRVVVPATAEASTGAPDIVTRREWGANESLRRGCSRDHEKVQQLFVHHTVGRNHDPHPKATMRSIYWYHAVRRGWCDIGYNFVISPGGRVFEGRYARDYGPGEIHDGETRNGKIVTGAHVSSYNSGSVGVSLMGNYSKIRPSSRMRHALIRFLAWEARRHDLKPRAEHTYRNPVTGLRRRLPVIAGHRDAGYTECPGNYVYRALPSIRKAVARLVQKPANISLRSGAGSIDYGESVELSGVLTKKDGTPLADRRVILKKRKGLHGSWLNKEATRTGLDGSFTFTATPSRNLRFKAVFPGDKRFRRAESDTRVIRVRALVWLKAEGGTVVNDVPYFSTGDRVALSGRVRPAHPGDPVVLLIERSALGEYETFRKVSLNLNDESRFVRTGLAKASPGTYRARAIFPSAPHHTRGVSPNADFVIGP
jgi:hypothetical protein